MDAQDISRSSVLAIAAAWLAACNAPVVGTPSASACLSGHCGCDPDDTQPCGQCGLGTKTCQQDGTWGVCQNDFGCIPGATTGCNDTGVQTCLSDCTWGPCGQDGCTPGTTQPCGNCGTKRCLSDCTWDACDGEGVCAPGDTATSVCGNCGTEIDTCDSSCQWTVGGCENQGVCSPGTTNSCGTCGGTSTCQSDCSWGECSPCTCKTENVACATNADCCPGLACVPILSVGGDYGLKACAPCTWWCDL